MRKSPRIVAVEIAIHAHATEDLDKVKHSLANIIPENIRSSVKTKLRYLKGHYGNPIARITTRIEKKSALEFVKSIVSRMDENERRILSLYISSRYDRKQGRLFLRFSKQDAFRGYLRIMEGDDVIKVTIVFAGSPSLDEVKQFFEGLGVK